jgi:predicted transcriptional regulator
MLKSEEKKTETKEKQIKDRAYEIVGEALVSISNNTRAEITRYIQKHKEAAFEELRNEFNLNNNTLGFHLKKLQEAYIISQPDKRGHYILGELGKLMLCALDELEDKAPPILARIPTSKQ